MATNRLRPYSWKPVAGAATIGAIVGGIVFQSSVAVLAGAGTAGFVASRRDAIGNTVYAWSHALTSVSLERISEAGAAIDHCVMKTSGWKRRTWLERRKGVGGSALLSGLLGLSLYRDPLMVIVFAACGTLAATKNDKLGASMRSCGGSFIEVFQQTYATLARGVH